MKLAEWARRNGVHPQTAYRWFREGTMPVPARRLPSGTIMVDVVSDDTQGQVVVYARVSSADQRADQRADLDRQGARGTPGSTGPAARPPRPPPRTSREAVRAADRLERAGVPVRPRTG